MITDAILVYPVVSNLRQKRKIMTHEFFDHNSAPLQIGRVSLAVRDLQGVAAFYQRVLGLSQITLSSDIVTLGAGPLPLLDLVHNPIGARRNFQQAGLFHIAFLLPTRVDLVRWLAHALRQDIPLQGASDHLVSEALYLNDPEGNGVEIYADRPVALWHSPDGRIKMGTEALNVKDLLAAGASGHWAGMPDRGHIGHIHLQVGDIAQADAFYRDVLGFDIAARYPGASFFGSGGYHHQIAGNIWNSRNAGPRPKNALGLHHYEITVQTCALRDAILARAQTAHAPIDLSTDAPVLSDPWGNRIVLVTA